MSEEVDLSRFVEPDMDAPLDVHARIRKVPPDAVSRGMYFNDLYTLAEKRKAPISGRKEYKALSFYPTTEYMELSKEVADTAFMGLTTRAAFREIGRTVYPAFAESIVGKTLMTMAGKDYLRACRLGSKAYQTAVKPADISLTILEDQKIIVHMRQVWTFPECMQLGVWEGGFPVFGVDGRTKIDVLGPDSVDILVWW